jgi:hypothetical protein
VYFKCELPISDLILLLGSWAFIIRVSLPDSNLEVQEKCLITVYHSVGVMTHSCTT